MISVWIIEARVTEDEDWEIVTAEVDDMPMAQAVQELLEEDGITAVRGRELSDIPPAEREALEARWAARTVEEMDRWEIYHARAVVRLYEKRLREEGSLGEQDP